MTTKAKTAKRFDHLYRDFQQDGARLQEHVHAGCKALALAKSTAWRMAKTYLAIIGDAEKHNALLDQCRSAGLSIDDWLARWYGPMERLGDDYRELITAVQQGMTVKNYITQPARLFLARLPRKGRNPAREQAVPDLPRAEDPLDVQLAQAVARMKALETQLKEERKAHRETERKLDMLKDEFDRIEKRLGGLDKKLATC